MNDNKRKQNCFAWLRKKENWLPLSILASIPVLITASWISIFFAEYGAYFSQSYQKSLFDLINWKSGVYRDDIINVSIDGEQTYQNVSWIDFVSGSNRESKAIVKDKNGNGFACSIEEGESEAVYYDIVNSEKVNKRVEKKPDIMTFASKVAQFDFPVEEMSFKPTMANISVFKKDNYLKSYAELRGDKTYAFSLPGVGAKMELSNVKICFSNTPWKDEGNKLYFISANWGEKTIGISWVIHLIQG